MTAASKKPLRDKVEALRQAGRYEEARKLAEQALAAAEKAKPADEFDTLWWLMELGLLLQEQGRYTEAEPYLVRALAMAERMFGPDNVATVKGLSNLALNERGQGKFAEAEAHLKRALTISEKTRDDRALVLALNDLAEVYVAQGRYGEAEPLYLRAMELEIKRPANERRIATLQNNLAHLAWKRGQYAEAEIRYKKAIELLERSLGPDHPGTAQTIGSLAVVYQDQGRFEEAAPLLTRACQTLEQRLSANHPTVAACLATQASFLHLVGRYPQAEQLYRQAIRTYEQTVGSDAVEVGRTLANLGQLLIDTDRSAQAEPVLHRARGIFDRRLAPAHPESVMIANALALADIAQGKFGEAETELRRAVALARQVFPAKHPDFGQVLANLSGVLLEQKKTAEAFAIANEAAEIASSLQALSAASELKGAARSLKRQDAIFVQQIRAAYALAQAEPGREATLRDKAFAAAQFVAFDETGHAVAQMAARFETRSDRLGQLIHEQQDLLRQLRALDQLLADSIGSADPKMRAQASVFRSQTETISARIAAIDAQLRQESPAYSDLAVPRSLSVTEAQNLLGENEAIVLVLEATDHTFVFAVTRAAAQWLRVDLTRKELEQQVLTLRRQLDPSLATEPFSRTLAHALFQKLLAPLDPLLSQKAEIFIVPTGSLTSLPFSVLVTDPPLGGSTLDRDPTALRQTSWLIKRQALTTLPAVSSLRALRTYAARQAGSEAFAGFGDPVFDRATDTERRVRDASRYFKGQQTNLEMLRALPRLPATNDEVRAMAKLLGASDSDMYLRDRATEAQLKTRDLSRKRIIEIATHGLVAGDFGYAEPGLALSPPSGATALDDGYLSSSEAANLNLHADLVILSACDTGAGQRPGANGLSGLARAFILAGSKSLLVSHWSVGDRSAMLLTTRTVAGLKNNPTRGRSEALRQAMLSVLNEANEPTLANPTEWAPFVLVGEPRTN